ncbi:MAG: UDP-3-O-(3-hydroxymyristoyl)glucosamine N-acyltransferase [Proteobacteria bacterium]|nr:UDP-3-O-(3-hydroxymyristoyl)glucosamine N-acyltransferase [Pseudomonadota bacterium]MBU1714150.1 UDP-3-O-(3-hydroxymyristoyl)glucosamine N-acyltransferase [Pseudomonadota bacterium]
MSKRVSELAEMVHGEFVGSMDPEIFGLDDIESSGPGQISFITDHKRIDQLSQTSASAVIVPMFVERADKPLIRVRNPYLAAAVVHNFFLVKPFGANGIDQLASIGRDCTIPAEVSIGPMVVIGDRVRLGRRVSIGAGVVIGSDVLIDDDTFLHPNVTVLNGCLLGKRVIIHSGTVIGSDGYGYVVDDSGHHLKRPQVGFVQIDDDVEIGANSCVDRATFGKTWIKRGVKIDNLVQVAHNVEIGEDSLLVSQAGVAGSSTLGRGVVLAGQVAVNGHIKLGDGVIAGGKAGIAGDQPAGAVVAGFPAIPQKKWLRASIAFAKLPDLISEVRDLRRKVKGLCDKMKVVDGQ